MEPPAAPVVLFDTYSLLFRAHHALPPMNTVLGEPTSALYGFSTQLLKILREKRPSGVAFALDAPQATFRHERFAEYKAHRDAAPTPLVKQLRRLRDLLACLDVPVFCAPGFEADDVLATLATSFAEANAATLIVSGDRDLLQLVTPDVSVWFVGGRGQTPTLYDLAKVHERFELAPEKLPSYVALVGDASDNLPGVSGVGPRTASRLIREHGSIDGLLAALEQVKPDKLRAELAELADQLRLNEELARLCRDVPLPAGARAAPIGREGFERLREFFELLEFKSLLPRLAAIAGS